MCGGVNAKGKYIADLVAGDRAVSKAAIKQGLRAYAWDIRYDDWWQDLLRPPVQRSIMRDLKRQAIFAAMMAPPRQTFTLARNRTSIIPNVTA